MALAHVSALTNFLGTQAILIASRITTPLQGIFRQSEPLEYKHVQKMSVEPKVGQEVYSRYAFFWTIKNHLPISTHGSNQLKQPFNGSRAIKNGKPSHFDFLRSFLLQFGLTASDILVGLPIRLAHNQSSRLQDHGLSDIRGGFSSY